MKITENFPRKGGGTYRALDPKVHAQEVAIRNNIAWHKFTEDVTSRKEKLTDC